MSIEFVITAAICAIIAFSPSVRYCSLKLIWRIKNVETKNYFAVIPLLIVLFVSWLLFDLYNHGSAVDGIRNQLDRVGAEQQQAISDVRSVRQRLDRIANGIESVSERIDEAESRIITVKDRNRESAEIVRDSERRNEECRSIVEAIRETKKQD